MMEMIGRRVFYLSTTGRGGALAILAGAVIACAGLSPTQADADHKAIAQAALSEVIRPGYADFRAAAGDLRDKIESLCRVPSDAALDAAKQAFAKTVGTWSKVEILRFGPVTENNRFERLFYWPDPKGLGLRQVQAALAKQDEALTKPNTLAEKSVALQGLPALEYLLYGEASATLARDDIMGSPSAFRCAFARSVSIDMERIATSLAEGWRPGAADAKSFLDPAPNDPRYHAQTEVTLDLFKSFTSGIELVRDQKLGKPLGERPERARPKLAAFWRSGLTFENAAANLEGVRVLFARGGLAQVVAHESPGVEDSILFDLDRGIEVLRGIDKPVEEAMRDGNVRAKLEALRASLKSARDTAGDLIARGAGLSFGFNAMDGD